MQKAEWNKRFYAARRRRLTQLGFANYVDYLASEHWTQRRAAYEVAHERRCRYCGRTADHLHHRSYLRLGAELDDDLEWVCGPHHEEVTRFGSIQPPTERQKAILHENGYDDAFISGLTFGSAFALIGGLGRGEVEPPRGTGG